VKKLDNTDLRIIKIDMEELKDEVNTPQKDFCLLLNHILRVEISKVQEYKSEGGGK